MAITWTGTGGFFTRVGRQGKLASVLRTCQSSLASAYSSLMAQYDTLRLAVDGVPGLDQQTRLDWGNFLNVQRQSANSTVIEMVKADSPKAAQDMASALTEVVTQMRAATQSVKKCTVAASVTAGSANSGNGVCVVSPKRGDGLDQELIIPETANILCVQDSQTGGAVAGQEVFNYVGEVAAPSVWADTWPIGSGATTVLNVVDGAQDATAGTQFGNMLRNSDFESYAVANLPDGWVAVVGTAGTNFLKSTAQFFDGLASLQFVGGGTLTSLTQQFGQSVTGSAGTPLPNTSYAVNLWMKVDVVPAAGVMTIDLIDGTGAVVNDSQGVANSFTVSLNGLTTSWAARNGVFRIPKLVPNGLRIRVRISTALSGGTNLFIDRMAMARLTGLYPGGPGGAVFSGSIPFTSSAVSDRFSLAATNDYGGASNLDTFQWLFDRYFDTRTLGILLPSNVSPTIADTLITA